MSTVNVNPTSNTITVIDNGTQIITVNTQGPKGDDGTPGAVGPAGPTGSAGGGWYESNPYLTSSYNVIVSGSTYSSGSEHIFIGSSSFEGTVIFTNDISGSSSTTSSFGTYIGDGSQLSGITTTPTPGTVSGSQQITDLGFVTSSATSSFVTNDQTSSMSVLSSSYSTTASYAENASVPDGTVSSSAQITILGFVTSSATSSFITNSQTGSFAILETNVDFLNVGGSIFTGIRGLFSQFIGVSSIYDSEIGNLAVGINSSSGSGLILYGPVTSSNHISTSATVYADLFIGNGEELTGIILSSQTSSMSVLSSSYALTSSYAENASIPGGTISSSLQISNFGFAITSSNIFNGSQNIIGNITSSGDISSSGNIISEQFIGGGSQLTNLQRPISSSISLNITASNLNSGYFLEVGSVTCSIQSSSLVTCDVGSEFEFFQSSSGNFIFVTGSGVTLYSKDGNTQLTGQYSGASLKKIRENTWILVGDLG
jgi:hypothetical protein